MVGNSIVEGAEFSIPEPSLFGALQRTGEKNLAISRLFGQADTGLLGGSGLLGTLATDSILPRHRFDTQYGGGSGSGGDSLFGGQPGILGVKSVPFLLLAERYDSNVYFAPALPGLNRQDYVTSFTPGFLFLHNSQLVRTTLRTSATGEYYVNNPNLNYIGFNGVLTLSMNDLARRVVPGSTFLVSQSINYSPVITGFLYGTNNNPAAQSTQADDQPDTTTGFVSSQQLYRVESLSLNSTVAGSVPVTPTVQFGATYGYTTFRFGTPSVNEATGTNTAQTINSTSHSVQAGPAWRVTSSDTLSLRGIYDTADYGGGQGGYQAVGGSLGWARRISQSFNFRLYGGATKVEQDFGANGAAAQAATGVGYNGGAAVVYAGGPNTVSLLYTSGLSPSFVSAVGSMQNHTGQLVATRRFGDLLSISGGATYNHSESVNGNVNLPGTFFESYTGFASIAYRISREYFASLSYTAGTYHGNYYTPEVQSFGRNAVTVSINAYWF
jgi:hypothetical protein